MDVYHLDHKASSEGIGQIVDRYPELDIALLRLDTIHL